MRLRASVATRYSPLTIDIVRNSLVVDMLGLLTLDYRKLIAWQTKPDALAPADLARLKDSAINVFHPAVGFTQGDTCANCLADIERWNYFIATHSNDFVRIDAPGDLVRAKREGKIGIVLGFQNSAHFKTVDDVDRFYALGQRISLVSYAGNRLGGGSADPRDSGLTDFGARVIGRMNDVGMAVDVSHCGDRTTLDAISASKKPVLVTHANCRALVASTRCKTDDAIRKIARSGGVMGITMVGPFVSAAKPDMEAVVDHVDHVARIAGVEHVALGSDVDQDGRDHGGVHRYDLSGANYSRKIFDFTEALVRRKYSSDQIALILGGNFQRAMQSICARPESGAPAR